MAPLMTLSGDDIIEASLLKLTEEECGISTRVEEESICLGEKVKLPEVLGSLPECPEIPKLAKPAK